MKNFILCAFADEASKNLEGQISALKRNSVPCIELRGVNGVNVASFSTDMAIEIQTRLENNGISVFSLGSPLGKSDINAPFEQEVDKLNHLIEIAKIFKTKRIRIFSFYIPKNENPELYKDEVVSRLKTFVKIAECEDIILCHENEKGIFGDTVQRCLELYKSITSFAFRGIFDAANFIQCSIKNLSSEFDKLSPYIEYLHIKDAKENGTVVPAGYGIGELGDIIYKFLKIKPNGTLSVEPHLYVFSGSELLEHTPLAENFEYKNSNEAFDAAVGAVKNLLL